MKDKMLLDHEKQIQDCQRAIDQIKAQNKVSEIWEQEEISKLENKLCELKRQVYAQLTPWQRVTICRHPDRPHGVDYIKNMCTSFTEIFGDRLFRDDRSMITGLGMIGGQKFAIIAQEKGCDTDSRLYRNFGMSHPEGYRKALRLMKLAARFNLPVLSLIDTPGAYAGLAAEERGQGWAIANNLLEMSVLPTPIIVVLIGEGCSGGALGIGVGDVIGMLEHAYYSVIAPESGAAILWHDSTKKAEAAASFKMQAEDALRFNIIDTIIDEPQGGAHYDPQVVYRGVKDFVLEQRESLMQIPKRKLLERRYQKFRCIGAFSQDLAL